MPPFAIGPKRKRGWKTVVGVMVLVHGQHDAFDVLFDRGSIFPFLMSPCVPADDQDNRPDHDQCNDDSSRLFPS
jgi:hypothetical protein